MRGGVQRHFGEVDDAVLVAEPGLRAEGLTEEVGADFRHDDAGHLAPGEVDADADPVVVEYGVVIGVDVGHAVVFDAQQDERRVEQRPAVLVP
ncbi:MAG: hypothetical protein JWO67_7216 [Streptosporangiaceae bacterium]|nr:hypothetical protein [Streptosporangiaceae bacterium]